MHTGYLKKCSGPRENRHYLKKKKLIYLVVFKIVKRPKLLSNVSTSLNACHIPVYKVEKKLSVRSLAYLP